MVKVDKSGKLTDKKVTHVTVLVLKHTRATCSATIEVKIGKEAVRSVCHILAAYRIDCMDAHVFYCVEHGIERLLELGEYFDPCMINVVREK